MNSRTMIHRIRSMALCGVLLACAAVLSAQTSTGSGSTSTGSGSGSSGSSGSSNRFSSSRYGRERSGDNSYNNSVTQRDKELRDRNKKRDRNSNQTGTSGGKGPAGSGGRQMSTVKGKATPPKAPSGGSKPATTVEFKMKADPTGNLLYIESVSAAPTMNIVTGQGEKFSTRVVFRNGRRAKFRTVDISIKYDPQALKPLGIDDSDVAGDLGKPSIARVDQKRGILAYRAEFSRPLDRENLNVFRVEWKALSPTEFTPMTFLNTAEFPSRVMNGPDNVLFRSDNAAGQFDNPERAGLVDATVSITPDRETALNMEDDAASGMRLAHSISKGTAVGQVTLALRPRARSVAAGEDLLVDVVYSNPRRTDIDTIKMKIRFDPRILQVVDNDEGNWITSGINILDGPYHDDLPFDFHMKNIAYNTSGEIQYEMGFSRKERIPSSGVIATIRFRAQAANGRHRSRVRPRGGPEIGADGRVVPGLQPDRRPG